MPGLPPPGKRPRWTWKEARAWVQGRFEANDFGPVYEAPFGNETTIDVSEMEGGRKPIHVCHRGHIVCTYHEDGSTVLGPDRLRTKSILMRLCCYTRSVVFERNGLWFVARPGHPDEVWPFVDGMVIDADGMPIGRRAEAMAALPAGPKVCPTCNGEGTVAE